MHGPAAESRIVRHAGNGLVLGLDRPGLEGLELHRRPIRALQHVPVDQARWRGQRRHRGRDPARQADPGQQVEHLLARVVVAGAFLERDDHVRQSVKRDRADVVVLRDAVHPDLDGHRDQPFHFLGRVPRPLCDDLDDGRRQVRIGIHRQALQRSHARADQHEHQQDDEKRLRQRRGHEAVHEGRRHGRRRWQLVAHWICLNWMNSAPSSTMRSPVASPSGITTWSPVRGPRVTCRRAKLPSLWAT